MQDYLPLLLGFCGLLTLTVLAVIDFKTWLLPDKWNLTLALLGCAFHFSTGFSFLTPADMTIGAVLGAGTLLVIRFFGNSYYKQDTLGLGDVKLLGAAGLWLGAEGVVLALTAGAFAGLLHGLSVASLRSIKEKTAFSINKLYIPAGPGFCIGIAAIGIKMFLFPA